MSQKTLLHFPTNSSFKPAVRNLRMHHQTQHSTDIQYLQVAAQSKQVLN